MSAEARLQEFHREMDDRRARGLISTAAEIARIAMRTKLSLPEALLQIQLNTEFRRSQFNDLVDGTTSLIGTLCGAGGTNRVLEYFSMPALLTATLAEAGAPISYILPYRGIFEPINILLEGKSASLFQNIKDLDPKSKFDAIVCQPPLNQRSSSDLADGYGGEIVRDLLPILADKGTLYWFTARGVLHDPRAQKTFADLAGDGIFVAATIDVAPGAFIGSMIEGVVLVLRRGLQPRFVGALRDREAAVPMASAFLAGPSKKNGPNWIWLGSGDKRTYAQVEQERLLQKLLPRGRHSMISLGSLLKSEHVVKADKSIDDQTSGFLFIPEYAGSRVTVELAEQTVKPKAVYRLTIDPAMANARYLAQVLNGPYGKYLRASAASGATIQRISVNSLLSMEIPLPDLATQEQIARIDGDIALLQAAIRDLRTEVDQNWITLPDVSQRIDGLKGVLDIERQIADWWKELPYPLATIYRRYQVSADPKERLETLLHFFEMMAVFLATIGTSHVRAMRRDWQEVMAKWLHPTGGAGIERADFGFWVNLASASLKDNSRISSDKELRAIAIETAGLELVEVAASVGALGKATDVLRVANRYRNTWVGHGGHIKKSDAAKVVDELQQTVRDLYEITASMFRRFKLVRPGLAEVTDTGMRFQIERLSGSDPTFERNLVELDRPAKTNTLAFWMVGSRAMCRALPFVRMGAPQAPQETSFYVFNRVEQGSCRWISYQEAREQVFLATDDELFSLIALEKSAG